MTDTWKKSIEIEINKEGKKLYSEKHFLENAAFYYLLGLRTSLWACEEDILAEKISKILDARYNTDKTKEPNEAVESNV